MIECTIGTETIETEAGNYTLTFVVDEYADQPYDDGFVLIKNGGSDRVNVDTSKTDESWLTPNDPVRAARSVVADKSDSWEWEFRSGAALVRYLTLKGFMGVTIVSDDYSPTEPSADRFERVYGVAWDVGGSTDQEGCRQNVASDLAAWRAWAEGDVFGYVLTNPAGEEVDSCFGFYGYDRERAYVLEQATEAARADAADDIEAARAEAERLFVAANLVGAGFVGVI